MKRLRVHRSSLSICMLILLAACSENQEPLSKVSGKSITSLFEGFTYLGERFKHVETDPLERGRDYPVGLVDRKEYVFVRSADGRAADMALKVLPARLRALGFDIIDAPAADGTGLLFLDGGTVLFSIRARKDGCDLSIGKSSSMDPATEARWPFGGNKDTELGVYVLAVAGSACGL